MHGLHERRIVDWSVISLQIVFEFTLFCSHVFFIGIVYVESNFETHVAWIFRKHPFDFYHHFGPGRGHRIVFYPWTVFQYIVVDGIHRVAFFCTLFIHFCASVQVCAVWAVGLGARLFSHWESAALETIHPGNRIIIKHRYLVKAFSSFAKPGSKQKYSKVPLCGNLYRYSSNTSPHLESLIFGDNKTEVFLALWELTPFCKNHQDHLHCIAPPCCPYCLYPIVCYPIV